jgi:hypothetical protein
MLRDTMPMMVAMAGISTNEEAALDRLAAEFGWSLRRVAGIRQVEDLIAAGDLVAVLFSPYGLGLTWEQALHAVQALAPGAFPIVCHGFAEPIDWPQLAEAGVFHALRLPFHLSEVRQSFGFVREARSRSQESAARTPAVELSKLRKAVGGIKETITPSTKLAASPGV